MAWIVVIFSQFEKAVHLCSVISSAWAHGLALGTRREDGEVREQAHRYVLLIKHEVGESPWTREWIMHETRGEETEICRSGEVNSRGNSFGESFLCSKQPRLPSWSQTCSVSGVQGVCSLLHVDKMMQGKSFDTHLFQSMDHETGHSCAQTYIRPPCWFCIDIVDVSLWHPCGCFVPLDHS